MQCKGGGGITIIKKIKGDYWNYQGGEEEGAVIVKLFFSLLRLKVNLVLVVSHTLSYPSLFPPPEFLNVKSFSFETRIQPEKNMKFKMLQLKFHFLCPNKEINWSQ